MALNRLIISSLSVRNMLLDLILSKLKWQNSTDSQNFLLPAIIFSFKLTKYSFFLYSLKVIRKNCVAYCVCVKRITICTCLCSSSSPSSRSSASLIRNIGEFRAKKYFTDHWTANTIHGFRDSFPVLKIHACY